MVLIFCANCLEAILLNLELYQFIITIKRIVLTNAAGKLSADSGFHSAMTRWKYSGRFLSFLLYLFYFNNVPVSRRGQSYARNFTSLGIKFAIRNVAKLKTKPDKIKHPKSAVCVGEF